MNIKKLKKLGSEYLLIIFGTFCYTIGLSFFLVPAGAYSSGILGISQLLRTILFSVLSKETFGSVDPAGVINLLLNLPLLYLAYKALSRDFFLKTMVVIALQTVLLSIYEVPKNHILDDTLSAMIVAAIMAGFGIGVILYAGGCTGGMDIISMYLTKKHQNFSVGKVNSTINYLIFASFAVIIDLKVALYSIIYAFISGIVVDKVHLQNIKVKVVIMTKSPVVHKVITKELERGVTYWRGFGAYADQPSYVLMTMVSKYELPRLTRIVKSLDKKAFITYSDNNYIDGNFVKRLDH